MLNFLQRIGKSLMFPIATLPAAALLVRLGKEDMLDIPFITAAGNGILGNLAIIFAIGIAMGLSHDGSGGAALAGAIGYLVLTEGAQSIDSDIDMKVFGGVIAGIAGGLLYNKYYNVKFPDWLAFFGGKRFVPIITSLVMVATAFVLGFVWPPVQDGLDALGNWILNAGTAGVGIYGVLNRLLIPVGLHHVMNAVIWFDFGTFTTASGEVFHGEINRFLNGDPEAGYFLAGFFPVMMFGLPAACAAMYVAAKKERKAAVGGLLFSIAFTSFLTGVTEPIEFSFMFLSPLLYVVHALLTGVSMMAAYLLDIRHGFGFSAGLIDYLLNFTLAQNPLLLAGLGIVMGAIYFVIFYFLIIKLDLKTPGREDEDMEEEQMETEKGDYDALAYHYIEAIGGMNNIESLDYCTTRLRMQITDQEKVDEKKLKRLGARGVMKMSKKNLQVIVGTTVEFVADAMRKRMDRGDTAAPDETVEGVQPCEKATSEKYLAGKDFALPIEGRVMELSEVPDEVFAQGMMGQGFAIDPSGDTFTSPVDGKVVNVFPTKHAIGLETESGIEILIHIGLDTVKLQGEGFELLVEDGQAVTKGTPLIKVDFDRIRDKVPSIVTPIVFTNLEDESLTLLETGNQHSQTTNIVTIQK
ncbi:PTS N-acetyl glucosamine transporter subunits IIABC [Pontibacillus chungwhensis BH030062]|uniref:PTS N-acetyl glucosamine transporter subunits IIABC n=1 Tax=Pontibacillus chungwhensis BH030062 TaxID=1385513 RepID=A0A0A2UU09_9BACI|nr:N-acetylglucosamine-specific PTS transporter subunit IIBC [Pontibacillus chungwhensis]KGP91379.1 PTS N-acetyl glucosamine transporter subunits IIABC [Pontibacillus chungwhensis BH030062]